MAKASSSGQHYLECDSCEENPAQFFCKMCAGNLCEPCKREHGKKKITRSHEIISLSSNNEDLLDLLYCSEHTTKKVECFCKLCREPVCTDCIMQSHNGHSVKSLTTVYKELKDLSMREKEEIENIILPKYKELLSGEKEKRSAFRKKADKIQMKIEQHTQNVVERAKETGQQTVENLRKVENEVLTEMDTFADNIEKNIKQLQEMSKQISTKLEAKPQISFFKSTHRNGLESFQKLPTPTDYTLQDIETVHIDLGKPPVLQIARVRQEEECDENEWVPPFAGDSDDD